MLSVYKNLKTQPNRLRQIKLLLITVIIDKLHEQGKTHAKKNIINEIENERVSERLIKVCSETAQTRTESLKDNSSNNSCTDSPLERPRRLSTPDVVDCVAPTAFNGVIPPMRRSTSCGDEMMTRSARTARATGRSYLIRERNDGESLLANLMNLRNIMLGQQGAAQQV